MNAVPSPPAAAASPAPIGEEFGRPAGGWRRALYSVVFESDTRAGRWFDLILIWLIVASVALVVLNSVASVRARYAPLFDAVEWGFTLLFSAEYIARLMSVRQPWRYARSFYGIIDLLAVLPTWLAILLPELYALIDVRVLRLLRIFRILKLGEYVAEFGALGRALVASRRKIAVFLLFVMMVTVVMGTLMYLVEGPGNGFTSIPIGVYWAITTLTTVGFGDIAPHTGWGRFIASVMMLLGWGVLAVPTGIVSAEFTMQRLPRFLTASRNCPECLSEGHATSARFCADCGAALPPFRHEASSPRG